MMTATLKADRASINRAPKGGAVSAVNGLFYKGGQFMPMVVEVVEARPAPLEGSSRQVLWATRLRAEAIKALDEEIYARLAGLDTAPKSEAKRDRKAVVPFMVRRHRLMTERSAARVIDNRSALV